jgi:imidazoleglycerol-phosphate dehydratase
MQTRDLPLSNLAGSEHSSALVLPLRTATVQRKTGETDVQATVNLDGQGKADNQTGVPFLDHMLDQICSHGLLDLEIRATGDLHIDDHHTNEDVGITFGQALAKALGDRKGIYRFWLP